MTLHDPVAVYDAATNVEAHLVRTLLVEEGIEAQVVEDLSTGGLWMFGLLPGIHKPQVWVQRADLQRAQPLLVEYERQEAERQAAHQQAAATGEPIKVTCEDCGQAAMFPAEHQGTVQECPHCGAYVDVGEIEPFWGEEAEEDS